VLEGINGKISDALELARPKTIYLIRNGDDRNRCVPMLLTPRNARDFGQVCQRISNRLRLEAPCRMLYDLSGVRIVEMSELENGQTYVAVGRIAFTQVGYKPAPPPKKFGRKNTHVVRSGLMVSKQRGPRDMRTLLQKKLKVAEIVGRLGRTWTGDTPATPAGPIGTGAPTARHAGKPRPICEYEIIVYTGTDEDAGIDSKVYITLFGDMGDSGRRLLTDDEKSFCKGSRDVLQIQVPRVGDIESIKIEHDSTVDRRWFVEHVEVVDLSTGGSAGSGDSGGAIKKFFWFNRWVEMPPSSPTPPEPGAGAHDERDGAGGTASRMQSPSSRGPRREAAAVAMATLCMDAESAAAEAKGLASGLTLDSLREIANAYLALENRLVTICNDKGQTKRFWKQLAAASDSSHHVPLHEFWNMCTESFPILGNMSARMRAFNRTIVKLSVDSENRVAKHTFRLLMLNTFYFCRAYSVFDTDEDGSADADLSVASLTEKIPFLGLNMSDAEVQREFAAINTANGREGAGAVQLDDFCTWYAARKVPDDVKEEANLAEEKERKKEEKKASMRPFWCNPCLGFACVAWRLSACSAWCDYLGLGACLGFELGV
jgi:hypothetical protein